MADLVVPALGESITEAVIGKWLVGVGEHVNADDPVVDLETDKITVQLPAPVAGSLTEQRAAEGSTVKVGDIVGQIGAAKAAAAKSEKGASPEKKAEAAAAPEGEDVEAAAEGEDVEAASAPAEADARAGSAGEAKAKDESLAPDPAPRKAESAPSENSPDASSGGRVLTPSQRRAQREGRAVESPAQGGSPASGAREEVVAMSPLRKRIAERLVQAQQSSASLTTFNEVDMSKILELRSRYKEDFQSSHQVKLGFMSFAVKACVAALADFPGLNAEIRGDNIVYKKFYDVGIAVGTPRGLVVPVLRGCDQLSFAGVEGGIHALAAKARDNKLVLSDLTGGTFTITNGGVYGSMMSTPLLNFPQTGILGLHNIVERGVAVDGKLALRPIMYIALTYDHRVVDGSEAVSFLVAVKERMEDPQRLLFEV